MNRRDYRSFRPVLEWAARYRDADTDAEFLQARAELAAAIIRWEHNLEPGTPLEVEIRSSEERTDPRGNAPRGWRGVTDAINEWPDDVPFARSSWCSTPWWRLYAAAQRWARRASWSVVKGVAA